MESKVFSGTEIKLNIHIDPINGVTMDEYDFEVELICGSFKRQSLIVKKEETRRVDSDNYLVCVDTKSMGVGRLICRVSAFLPDGDFKDGKRTEISEVDTGIEIVKGL